MAEVGHARLSQQAAGRRQPRETSRVRAPRCRFRSEACRFRIERSCDDRIMKLGLLVTLALTAAACGDDAGSGDDAAPIDAPGDPAPDAHPVVAPIEHVVVIVQENHTFDNYFGGWCTAPAGSAPTCNDGPACCEAAPATDPTGVAPTVLDDAANGAYDPDHTQDCELAEMNGGAMDRYASGTSCADPRNVAVSPASVVATYQGWATQYALADRYFQPIVGSSSSNDMYFAVAQYVFTDNEFKPDSNGAGCTLPATRVTYDGVTTIADLLLANGNTFAFYAQGYADMLAATFCPAAPDDCPFGLPTTPCDYDPSDVPFEYYAQFLDNPQYMKDLADLAADVDAGTLPDVSFVKHVGYRNEHPGYGTTLTAGMDSAAAVVATIAGSAYADDTLILLVWDEGGGFFDHVTPPPTSAVDGQPYGTRVPLLAIGPHARPGFVSHVELEHSSVVRFLEWNFLGATGQLGGRDAVVHNLGSLLDPALNVPD
jgi:phospholipase C